MQLQHIWAENFLKGGGGGEGPTSDHFIKTHNK